MRKLKAAALTVLSAAGLLVGTGTAHADALRCGDNDNGELCLLTYNTGASVTKARATFRYKKFPTNYCGGGFRDEPGIVFVHFTLSGTLKNGQRFAQAGYGACDVRNTYGENGETELKVFYVNRDFKSKSKLCLRSDYNAPTSNDPIFACYIVP
ncbi:hypothetical protein [Actinocrispum wychmicini]|uniref:Peptidase inhibitor family I36 n=1 Tax=Actinocrispum wychmicini TaxID=1213861 RepID=A0A4R2J7N1_9PSEU|nr:hypothetical protein [Actinocrispum wychmicini]TCO52616.1 hypothetical protein EV192_112348 [Actinocrispum wychmicini]